MKPSIEEIPDKEEHLNSTQQPLDVDELLVLISTIILPLEEQIPKEFHEFLESCMVSWISNMGSQNWIEKNFCVKEHLMT